MIRAPVVRTYDKAPPLATVSPPKSSLRSNGTSQGCTISAGVAVFLNLDSVARAAEWKYIAIDTDLARVKRAVRLTGAALWVILSSQGIFIALMNGPRMPVDELLGLPGVRMPECMKKFNLRDCRAISGQYQAISWRPRRLLAQLAAREGLCRRYRQ